MAKFYGSQDKTVLLLFTACITLYSVSCNMQQLMQTIFEYACNTFYTQSPAKLCCLLNQLGTPVLQTL